MNKIFFTSPEKKPEASPSNTAKTQSLLQSLFKTNKQKNQIAYA